MGWAAVCAGGRRLVRLLVLLVAPRVFRAPRLLLWAGPLCVPVGGGPPARSPHASFARSGRSRGPPWPCRRPPAPRPGPSVPPAPFTPVGSGVLTCGLARRLVVRPGLAAAHRHRSQAPRLEARPCPPVPPASFTPVGPGRWCVARCVVLVPGLALAPPAGTAAGISD